MFINLQITWIYNVGKKWYIIDLESTNSISPSSNIGLLLLLKKYFVIYATFEGGGGIGVCSNKNLDLDDPGRVVDFDSLGIVQLHQVTVRIKLHHHVVLQWPMKTNVKSTHRD